MAKYYLIKQKPYLLLTQLYNKFYPLDRFEKPIISYNKHAIIKSFQKFS